MSNYPTKRELCLTELLERGTYGLHPLDVNVTDITHANRMDADGKFWTMTLSTDVSILIHLGINIAKHPDPLISVRGYKAQFKRYCLTDISAVKKAILLVNKWRVERGALPLSPDSCARYLAYYQVSGEAA